jgi:hypothetical protein
VRPLTCRVCALRPTAGPTGLFCAECQRSYDRARDQDGTIAGAIVWAASRARSAVTRARGRKKSAREIRKRLGWPPPSTEEQDRNLEENLISLGVT